MSLILVTGGARSGKSRWAEQRATELADLTGSNVTYVATAEVRDLDMRLRVAQHRKTRPRAWATIEAPTGIAAAILRKGQLRPGSVLILDDIVALVSNLMTGENAVTEPPKVEQAARAELRAVLRIVRERRATLIVVTSEMGSGLVPDRALARTYRDAVGRTNQWLAARADGVWFLASGMALPLHELAIPVLRDDDP